jgi:hypothetical protein
MPSDNNKDSSDRRNDTDPFENLISSVERFVDEQVSSILQSVIGLPSSTTGSRDWRNLTDAQRKDSEDWNYESEQKGQDIENSKEFKKNIPQRTEKWNREADEDFWKKYPRVWETHSENKQTIKDPLESEQLDRRPITTLGALRLSRFLQNSIYSPINLETDPNLRVYGSHWRQAFSDLINATEGHPMATNDELLRIRSQSAEEWYRNFLRTWSYKYHEKMIQRRFESTWPESLPFPLRILHPRELDAEFREHEKMLQAARSLNRAAIEDEESYKNGSAPKNEYTELDMYEHWSQDEQEHEHDTSVSTNYQSSPNNSTQTSTQTTSPASSIISTMTTTHKVTLPDGSVRTHRVLKKRFADGHEESNETEEIEPPTGNRPNQGKILGELHDAQTKQEKTDGPERSKEQERKRGGWFWS